MAALETVAALPCRYGAPPPPARRAATLALVVAVHAGLVALLLTRQELLPDMVERAALNAFDVVPPPPPTLPPPPPATARAEAAAPRSAPTSGGSSGRIAQVPAPAPVGAAPTRETTPVPQPAPAPPPQIGIGTAADLAGLGAAGVIGTSAGLGNGRGTGTGDGVGGGSGSGAGDGDGGTRWVRADWIEKPSPAEWSRVWPADARRYEVHGRVELACVVPRPGTPERCRVVSEKPARMGFGRAALDLSRLPSFRIRPVLEGEQHRGDIQVLFPVVFTPIRTPPMR